MLGFFIFALVINIIAVIVCGRGAYLQFVRWNYPAFGWMNVIFVVLNLGCICLNTFNIVNYLNR